MMIFLAAVLGAIANRLRGGLWGDNIRAAASRLSVVRSLDGWMIGWGWLNADSKPGASVWNTTTGRAIWAGAALAVALAAGGGWWSIAIGVGAFVGCVAGQYGGLAMGHRGAVPTISPWLSMTGWGLARVFWPIAVLIYSTGNFQGALVLAGAGAICAPVYWVVWYAPTWAYLPGLGYGDGPAQGYDPPQLAEAIWGAVALAALYLVARDLS